MTNLRAALDYIIWELATLYFTPPLREEIQKDRRLASFSLATGPADIYFREHMKSLADRRIPADAISLIEAIQPHNGGYEPLRFLSKLVNTDKHRMPLLATSYIPMVAWCAEAGGRITGIGMVPFGLDTETERSLRARLKEMGVEADFSISVAFKDVTMPRGPVDRTLEDILKTIADIIPRFDKFF
jgi:hypothetical protein